MKSSLYRPHLLLADSTVREADFVDGRLARQRVYQGRFTLPR